MASTKLTNAERNFIDSYFHEHMDPVKAGLVDPTDEQRKRPLAQHLTEFKRYLQNKGVTPKQVHTAITQIQSIVDANKWKLIGDISASGTLEFLGELRRSGKSAQTYNHYLSRSSSSPGGWCAIAARRSIRWPTCRS